MKEQANISTTFLQALDKRITFPLQKECRRDNSK